MNKIIFQLGILGFCIAAVVFGGSGGSVLDIVSRSFIVFVGIVFAAMALLLVGGAMLEKNTSQKVLDKKAEQTTAQQNQ
jgi:high-affinity Fe2+/Pb2+ permease